MWGHNSVHNSHRVGQNKNDNCIHKGYFQSLMKSWALEVKGRQTKFFRFVYFLLSTKKYLLILFHASIIKLKEVSHLGLAGYFPREGTV